MPQLKVKHNLEPEELCKAIVGLAKGSEIEEDVIEELQKAINNEQVSEPRDPYLKELHAEMHELFADAIVWVRDFTEQYLLKDTKRRMFFKAKTPQYLDRPLTKQEVKALQEAIKERFGFIAAQLDSDFEPDKATLDQWKKLGIIDKKVTAKDFATKEGRKLIQNAFLWGRFELAVGKGATNKAELVRLALESPLTKIDKHAVAVAEAQAAQYITSFGESMASVAGQALRERNRQIVKDMVAGVHKKELTAIQMREGAPEQLVTDWQGLSSELYHTMEDRTRDWDRIAFYELNDSKRYGKAMGLMEKYGPDMQVYKTPRATACPQCLELYLEADGFPRLFKIGDMMSLGSNVGRKPMPTRGGKVQSRARKDKKEVLQPVAGLVHPYCQCDGPDVFTGYEAWADKRI